MRMLLRVCLIATLLICCVLLNCASEHKKRKGEEFQSNEKNASSNIKLRRNYTTAHDGRSEAVSPKKKVKKTGNKRISMGPRSDISCTTLGGICQPNRYICQGRYLKDKCSGTKMRQCCMPVRAWSVLCAGHHNNRVRACDVHGCGAFNSKRGNGLHKAVDLVCDDYGIANAPFSGTLAGPVSRKDPAGNQYEGLRLLSDVVKTFH
ncbi:uncharacterized protein LOC120802075 isoform X2 [Xiphias gladius]|uniref:uncharacterized protein LOC120802075 isoform X2 n=1 Tax=Xiphias gladius TaxID=8245 RepID=UPI001A9A04E1|nr:uncharacterized protein LOC120802075 isoform X2 [Xiphias gladius]